MKTHETETEPQQQTPPAASPREVEMLILSPQQQPPPNGTNQQREPSVYHDHDHDHQAPSNESSLWMEIPETHYKGTSRLGGYRNMGLGCLKGLGCIFMLMIIINALLVGVVVEEEVSAAATVATAAATEEPYHEEEVAVEVPTSQQFLYERHHEEEEAATAEQKPTPPTIQQFPYEGSFDTDMHLTPYHHRHPSDNNNGRLSAEMITHWKNATSGHIKDYIISKYPEFVSFLSVESKIKGDIGDGTENELFMEIRVQLSFRSASSNNNDPDGVDDVYVGPDTFIGKLVLAAFESSTDQANYVMRLHQTAFPQFAEIRNVLVEYD